jgi:hypothetical protein
LSTFPSATQKGDAFFIPSSSNIRKNFPDHFSDRVAKEDLIFISRWFNQEMEGGIQNI